MEYSLFRSSINTGFIDDIYLQIKQMGGITDLKSNPTPITSQAADMPHFSLKLEI